MGNKIAAESRDNVVVQCAITEDPNLEQCGVCYRCRHGEVCRNRTRNVILEPMQVQVDRKRQRFENREKAFEEFFVNLPL